MYNLRSRQVTFKMPETGDQQATANGGSEDSKDKQLDDLLVTLNKMTQVMEINTKKGNSASNIPMDTFSGHPSEDAAQWLEKFDAWIAFNGWKDNADKIVSAMQLKLEGNALSWFQALPLGVKKNSGALFKGFSDHFTSLHPTWMLEQQLYERSMTTGEGLEEYITDIQRRCKRLQKTDKETVTAFIRGLPASLRLFVIQKNPKDFREAIQSARLAQESLSAFPTLETGTTTVINQTLKQQQEAIHELTKAIETMKTESAIRVNAAANGRSFMKCQLCDKAGHNAKMCRKYTVREKKNSQKDGSACYKCGKEGHFARNCTEN